MKIISKIENLILTHIKENYQLRFIIQSHRSWGKTFHNYMGESEFAEKYNNLICGLDDESVFAVNKILTRLRDAKNFKPSKLTSEELLELGEIKTKFHNKSIKLSKNNFTYGKYKLPVDGFEASVFFYKHHIDQFKTLQKIRTKNIIDAGGFIGDSALIFSGYTNEKVYSFEPSEKNYQHILETIKLNDSKNIVPINKALSDTEEPLSISFCGSCTTVKNGDSTAKKTPAITLDRFIAENNLKIGLIKTDLEGWEKMFLKGAEKTIKSQKPALIISIYHGASDFFEIKPLIESWNLGYKFRIIKSADFSLFYETVLLAEVL